jgi:hypothetical protein
VSLLVHRLSERILLARVECLNILVVKSLFVNLDARAKQQQLWKLLDCKTNSIGCGFEAAITDPFRALAIAPRIQFGRYIIIKIVHTAHHTPADANTLKQHHVCGGPTGRLTEHASTFFLLKSRNREDVLISAIDPKRTSDLIATRRPVVKC